MGHAIHDVVIITHKGGCRPWYLLHLFAPLVVLRRCGFNGASECEIPRGGLDGLLCCQTPILMPFIDGGVELFAVLAAVLVRVKMPIADTNPHSSTVDEDGNDRVAIPMLSGMVSEDGRGRIGVWLALQGTPRAIINVAPIPLQFAMLCIKGRFGGGSVQSPGDCDRLVGN